MNTLKFMGRALLARNYRLFFIGQSVSLVGTWLQQTALPWLVYSMTSSAYLLGVYAFLSQIPTFLLTSFAGVYIDRMDRRKILLITQGASLVQAFLLWFLFVTHQLNVPTIMILSLIYGVINAFDIPARQSFVVEMVEKKEDLGNAIALNSSMVHAARLIGPSIAGVLIATVGEGMCFLLNALSFVAVMVSLLKMRIKPRKIEDPHTSIWQGMQEGIIYVKNHLPMRSIMILVAVVGLTGMPYMVFIPVFAKDIFTGNASTLGFLIGAAGLGSLVGSFYLASQQGIKGFGKIIVMAACVFSLGIMALALSTVFWLSLICMFLIGFGMMILFAGSNTVLQTIVDDDKRGRVLGLYTVCFMGMIPIGSFLEGWLANRSGVSLTVFLGGLMSLLAAFQFAKALPAIRQVMHKIRENKATQALADPASS